VGSNNPDGVEIKKGPKGNRWDALKPADGIPFHPYYTVKDLVGVGFFLLIAAFIIFFAPTFGGWFLEHDNSIMANNLVTPAEIKPVWYFTPFYAIVRMIPSFAGTAVWGVLAMFGAIAVLFLLPWFDRGRSSRSATAVPATRWRWACSCCRSSVSVRSVRASPPK
jgi:Cytochrome b subunit of the bc complex